MIIDKDFYLEKILLNIFDSQRPLPWNWLSAV